MLGFFEDVYVRKFNFTYELALSTRPDNFIGSLEQWDDAEDQACVQYSLLVKYAFRGCLCGSSGLG